MRVDREKNIIKILLEDGSLDTKIVIDVLDNKFDYFNEAYPFLKPSSEIGVSKADFEYFYNFLRALLVNWNEREIYPKTKDRIISEKVITALFDKSCWIDEAYHYPSDVSKDILMFLINIIPKYFLVQLKFKPHILEMINIEISHNWIISEVFKIEYNLNSILNAKIITQLGFLTLNILTKSFEMNESGKIKAFTKKNKRIIFNDDLCEVFKNEIKFWDILTIRGSFSISPNKKYTTEMFEHTKDLIYNSKVKEYTAFNMTLNEFGFDPNREKEGDMQNSYRKQYKKYLDGKIRG